MQNIIQKKDGIIYDYGKYLKDNSSECHICPAGTYGISFINSCPKCGITNI